jgi:F420-dependent oxidoreductase-like protein
MKLGILAGGFGPKATVNLDAIRHAEELGYDSAWTAEAYGNDAVTMATWVLASTTKIKAGTAIMQMPARTPAMAAMTAMTLDHLSGGRFILGLGPSGPQVAEGWHGMPYGKPLTRTKEYISIIRKILAREEPLTHEGEHYSIPNTGAGTTGLGKPLKSILHGNPQIPILTASISPNGLRCAGEVSDGVFPLWMNPERTELVSDHVKEGLAKRSDGVSFDDFALQPGVSVVISDDLEKARMPIKMNLALYIGGMGARDKNFYNDYCKRLGYEEAAVTIQDAFLSGDRGTAVNAVPDELVDSMNLIGPADRIKDRLSAWRDAGKRGEITTMMIAGGQPEALELVASEML